MVSHMFPNVTLSGLPVNVESPLCDLMAPKGTTILTAAQCRAARAGLEISGPELADMAEVTRQTLSRFENGKTSPNAVTARALRRVLEGLGVEFPNLRTVVLPEDLPHKKGGTA